MKRFVLMAVILITVLSVSAAQAAKRDPFVPLIGQEKTQVTGLSDVASIEDIRLEGIAAGADGKKAVMMNGEILNENEKIGEVEVKKIETKSVTILISGKAFSLELPEEGGAKSE